MGRHRFGRRSLVALGTCHELLQEVLHEAIIRSPRDFTVLEGHRPEARQNEMVERGTSQLRWPHSNHNSQPSMAVDVAPWPIDWHDSHAFTWLAGFIMGIGLPIVEPEGYTLEWGGHWASFKDRPHIQLVPLVDTLEAA